MKQVLQNLKTSTIEVADVPTPLCRPGHLLIATRRSLISAGTERMLVEFGQANMLPKARARPELRRQLTALTPSRTYLSEMPGEIIIRVVRGSDYMNADDTALLREIRKRVGDETSAFIEYIESLEWSYNSKLRFEVSETPEGQLEISDTRNLSHPFKGKI